MTPLCLFAFFLKEKLTTKVSKSFDLLSDKLIDMYGSLGNSFSRIGWLAVGWVT